MRFLRTWGPALFTWSLLCATIVASCRSAEQEPEAELQPVMEPSDAPSDFQADVKALVRDCPLDKPVELGFSPLQARGLWGETTDCGDRYLIVIDPSGCAAVTQDTLIHEWAHAMTLHAGGARPQSHSAYWGLAYAQCYRSVVGD